MSVGKGLAASGVPREQVWITTKVWTSHHGYEPALESAAESLEKLGVDYVDLLLIHAPVGPNEAKRLDTWRALEKLKADGKVCGLQACLHCFNASHGNTRFLQARSIGVSNYGAHHIQEILDAGTVVPAVNQVELHPWCARKELVEFCRSKEIAVEGYCPLARCRKFDDERLAKLCAETGKTEAQICIRWALQHGFITIPKSSNEGRISSNADVFSWSLTEAQMAMLDDFDEDYHVSWDPTVSA